MTRAVLIALCLIPGLLLAGPAAAQAGWRVIEIPRTGEPSAEEQGAGDLPRTRGAMLQDLAGTLGAVHYFVVSCEGRGNQYWRERMMALLDAEARDRYLRAAMIQAFNDQYRQRERAFPDCSAEARDARGKAAAHGLMLSEALAEPYW